MEFSTLWGQWCVDVTVKSWLLGIAAGAVILTARITNANTRHRIWTGVLCGMLTLPLLVHVTPRVPVPGWLLAIADETPGHNLLPGKSPVAGWEHQDAGPASNSQATDIPAELRSEGWLDPRVTQPYGSAVEPTTSNRNTVTPVATTTGGPLVEARKRSRERAASAVAPWWAISLSVAHLLISAVLLARIAAGLGLAWRMIRDATRIELNRIPVPPRVHVCESSRVSVPVTVGIFKPYILLPVGWCDWSEEKVRSALTHELAHVRRGDWLTTLAAEVNCAANWFNPLAWFVRRQLANLAELNCDDAVIEALGDRAAYATHLLEVSAQLATSGKRFHPPTHSIAMARRPAVEVRIDAILDESRSLASRLGRTGMATLLACIISVVLLIASLGPAAATDPDAPVPADTPNQEAVAEADKNSPQDDQSPVHYLYSGQVLTHDGHPAVGAHIWLVYWIRDEARPIRNEPDAVTDSNGQFRLEMARSDFYSGNDVLPPWQSAWLAVTKSGSGLAWAPAAAFEESGRALAEFDQEQDPYLSERLAVLRSISQQQGRTLRLSEEATLTGRVINSEGQPESGVQVTFIEAFTGADDSLDAWIHAATQSDVEFDSILATVPKRVTGRLAQRLIGSTKTDASGEYTIRGLGTDQLVRLALQSPRMVSEGLYCRTGDHEPFRMNAGVSLEVTVHGNRASHVAIPSRAVEGTVRNDATGTPIPGVVVRSQPTVSRRGSDQVVRTGSEFARAVTDEHGRFILTGLPRVDENTLHFVPPLESSMMPRTRRVNTSGLEITSIQADARLTPGVVVTGRVTDSSTGLGVTGFASYLAPSQDHRGGVRMLPKEPYTVQMPRVDPQGNFRMVVPRGAGYIGFRTPESAYEMSHDFPDDFVMLFSGMSMSQSGPYFHALEKLDLAGGETTVDLSMTVDRGKSYLGKFVDAFGATIEHGSYVGQNDAALWRHFRSGVFSVAGFGSGDVRRISFVSSDRKWSGTSVIEGEVAQPLVIQASASASIQGRVVDSSGVPVPDVKIYGSGVPMTTAEGSASEKGFSILPPERGEIVTDDDGRFEVEGLIAGLHYEFSGRVGHVFATQLGTLAEDLVLTAGETRDLGDLQLASPERQPSTQQAGGNSDTQPDGEQAATKMPRVTTDSGQSREAKASESQPAPEVQGKVVRRVRGVVVDSANRPVVGATLLWPRSKIYPLRSIDDIQLQAVATSGRDGRFEADLPFPTSPKLLPEYPLVAVAGGHGMSWKDLKDLASSPANTSHEVRLILPDEFPIRGQLTDSEGKPIVGAIPKVMSLYTDSSGSIDKLLRAWLDEWHMAFSQLDLATAVSASALNMPARVTPSDAQGFFELRGIGKEHVIRVEFASPEIAGIQTLFVARDEFQPKIYNESATAQATKSGVSVRNNLTLYGNGARIVTDPSRTIFGQITDQRSGKALAGVEVRGRTLSRSSAATLSDADGQYRLSGLNAIDTVISIEARLPGSRYMLFAQPVKQASDLQPIQFDFGLQPGVLLTGRVTEQDSGQPVSGRIRLVPLPENKWRENPRFADYKPKRTHAPVDANGDFRVVTVPGAHVVMMHASGMEIDGQYVRPFKIGEFSSKDRNRVKIHSSGDLFYSSSGNEVESFATGMKIVDIPADAVEHSVDLTVARGLEMLVDIRDSQGQPVKGALVSGVTEIAPIVYPAPESTVKIYALNPQKPRRIQFFHAEHNLTGMLTLRGDEKQRPTVKMTRARRIGGQAIDLDGLPLSNARIKLLWVDDIANALQRELDRQLPPVMTDDQGRFEVVAAFPGKIRLMFAVDNKQYRATKLLDGVQAIRSESEPGAVIQIGAIEAQPR